MTNHKVWLEVALNGAAGQAFQPGIPVEPADIIEQAVACADAGASIVHLHVYADGQPVEDADLYTRVFEGIREQVDVILYPTLALAGSLEERYAPLITLADRDLLEWGVIDPGSVNITHISQLGAGQDGILYANPDAHIRAGLELAAERRMRPAFAIYEPGFARLGAAMAAQYPDMPTPMYRIMFSDNLLFGMPPSLEGLDFYVKHLNRVAPGAPWMLSGLDANVEELVVPALEQGGHLRVGLEDAPFGSSATNLELVEQAVATIQKAGFELADVATIRAAQ